MLVRGDIIGRTGESERTEWGQREREWRERGGQEGGTVEKERKQREVAGDRESGHRERTEDSEGRGRAGGQKGVSPSRRLPLLLLLTWARGTLKGQGLGYIYV